MPSTLQCLNANTLMIEPQVQQHSTLEREDVLIIIPLCCTRIIPLVRSLPTSPYHINKIATQSMRPTAGRAVFHRLSFHHSFAHEVVMRLAPSLLRLSAATGHACVLWLSVLEVKTVLFESSFLTVSPI